MKEELITKAYEVAKERYAALGIDVEKVMEQLQKVAISMHCWQADDVIGFESGSSLTGGIQTTGNYPGKARNMEELRSDILKAASYIPGKHRLNLHEIYGDFGGTFVDRDQVEVKHFESWMQWAAENGMKLDFNSTSFSHPKSGNLSLANPDKGIRDFWIEHTKRCRAIAEEMGRCQGDPCIMNLWVHDGSKDVTVNRMKYRELFKDSLDRIFATEYKNMKDCLESKVFGIGLESYTVGSNEFCVGYSVQHQKLITIDTGHFHPTESAADKVSSMLLFVPELMLHVSRPIRWDSDHVTIMDDPTLELFQEIVRCNALDRVHIGLDYFDENDEPRKSFFKRHPKATAAALFAGWLAGKGILWWLDNKNELLSGPVQGADSSDELPAGASCETVTEGTSLELIPIDSEEAAQRLVHYNLNKRRLPENQRASAAKREEANALGIDIGNEYTIVDPYDRQNRKKTST